MKRVWFRPKAGLLVPRDPVGEPGVMFPPQGDWTPRTPYIARRVAEGCGTESDVEPGEAAAPKTEPAADAASPARRPAAVKPSAAS